MSLIKQKIKGGLAGLCSQWVKHHRKGRKWFLFGLAGNFRWWNLVFGFYDYCFNPSRKRARWLEASGRGAALTFCSCCFPGTLRHGPKAYILYIMTVLLLKRIETYLSKLAIMLPTFNLGWCSLVCVCEWIQGTDFTSILQFTDRLQNLSTNCSGLWTILPARCFPVIVSCLYVTATESNERDQFRAGWLDLQLWWFQSSINQHIASGLWSNTA